VDEHLFINIVELPLALKRQTFLSAEQCKVILCGQGIPPELPSSSVDRPKIWTGAKNFGGAKC